MATRTSTVGKEEPREATLNDSSAMDYKKGNDVDVDNGGSSSFPIDIEKNGDYQYELGEDLEARLAAQPFENEQLVWVCKSKGLKKKKNQKKNNLQSKKNDEPPSTESSVSIKDNTTTATGGDNHKIRQEPFLRARIVLTDDSDPADNDDRILVRYPKGSTYRVRPLHLWPILSHPHLIHTSNVNDNHNDNDNNNLPPPRNNTIHKGHVVVWPETDVYRRCCIQHTLVPHDYFIEVGCDYGITVAKVAATAMAVPGVMAGTTTETTTTTTSKSKTTEIQSKESTTLSTTTNNKHSYVLGIDKSTESIDIANTRYPHLHFSQWDILEEEEPHAAAANEQAANANENNDPKQQPQQQPPTIWEYLKQIRQERQTSDRRDNSDKDNPPSRPFSSLVVAIDINGNRELEAVVACLQKVQALWKPRLIIVKSRALHREMLMHRAQRQ